MAGLVCGARSHRLTVLGGTVSGNSACVIVILAVRREFPSGGSAMFRDAGPPCRLCPMPLAVPTRYVVDGVAGNQAPAPSGGS